MKKLAMAVAGLACLAGAAGAVNPGTSSVKAQIASNLSVLVTGTVDYGVVATSTVIVSSAITVQNNGSGVTETYRVKLADPAGWTAVAGAPGTETYRLSAKFDTVQPAAGAFVATDVLGTADVISGASPSGNLASATQDGFQTAFGSTKNLWFKFEAPTLTAITTQQTINITITATTP